MPGVEWRKSSYSDEQGGECVEVTSSCTTIVAMRDSKNPSGPVLTFSTIQWGAFLDAIRAGEFD